MRWLESEGSSYATGLVCVQGHGLCSDLDGNPEMVIKFCPKCGNSTLHQCPSCGAKIRGEHRGEGFIDIMRIGCYCHACGKAYPWTERKTQALKDMLNEVIEQEAERLKLEESIPDIITETPRSNIAILRFNKAIVNAGKIGGKALYDLLINIAAATVAKKITG